MPQRRVPSSQALLGPPAPHVDGKYGTGDEDAQGDTNQTQDSQGCNGDDDVGLVSLEGMTALSSLLDPAENDTEVLGIFDPAGCEVTVSVETKVSEVTGWTAWEFKIDTKGTNEGHAAG